MKRLISCFASDIKNMNSIELKNSILASEGRIILGETVVTKAPLIEGITDAEMMASFSADLILLNEYDVFTKYINGLEVENKIEYIKNITGRPVGINLEPVNSDVDSTMDLITISKGRIASKETFLEAKKQGVDFICLTGNPATGVTNDSIKEAIILAKKYYDGLIFAGKMHAAGVNEKV